MKAQKNKSPLMSGLFAFVLTFIFLLALVTAQFIYSFKDELFAKNLDAWTLVKMCSVSMVRLSGLVLPMSVLVMAVVYYRQQFRVGETTIQRAIKQAILPVIGACFVSFLWVSFIIPKAALHQMRMLYDIKMKHPDQPLQHSDLALFNDFPATRNLFQLGEAAGERNLLKKEIIISKMAGFPFLVLLSFLVGMFIGILNRHQRSPALLLAGIYFTVFPGLYYLVSWFEKLVQAQKISPLAGQLYLLLILAAISMLLHRYAAIRLQVEKRQV